MDKHESGVYNESTMAVASLLNDTVFKFVFGEEKRKPILICLLNALLLRRGKERIVEIDILNPHLERESLDDKLSILDIRARDGTGRQYNVEVQVEPPSWYVKRAVYYAAKLLSSQLVKGHQYDEVQQTIGISLLGRALLDDEEMHTICRLKNITTHREVTDVLELHFIEQVRSEIEAETAAKARTDGIVESARRMLAAGIERSEVARILELAEDGF